MTTLWLSNDSFACVVNGHAVFLDLKRDRYLTVPPDGLAELERTVVGWLSTHGGPVPRSPTAKSDVVLTLIKEGLLTEDISNGKEAAAVQISTPASTFWPNLPVDRRNIAWCHSRNFLLSWFRARWMLRFTPLRDVVRRIQLRKADALSRGRRLDLEQAHELSTTYFALQATFLSAKDICLLSSVAMIEFLAIYEIYAMIVIGVRLDPFSAHAWVQSDSVSFSDPLSCILSHTPIMAI
jgi:hypothetical protein